MSENISYNYLRVSPSTNQHCLDQIASFDKARINTIYTMHQTEGRGQIGRTWYCGQGKDLAMSMIYFPQGLKASEQFKLNIQLSLVIREVVEELAQKEATIKWPNDIYIGSKKVAGILIQNMVRGDNISSSILGIGLNVNSFYFPEELPNPCSLFQISGREHDIVSVVHKISESFNARLKKEEPILVLTQQYEDCMYCKGVSRKFMIDEHIVDGVITGIEDDGHLKMHIDSQERFFGFREISMIIS